VKHSKFLTLLLFCVFANPALAEDAPTTGHQHKPGMQHGDMHAEGLPSETGQSAFAAIQEIVAKLEADPATDWSKVNIEALRQHLIDMDAVTLNAMVQIEQRPDGRKFIVSGEGRVVLSIQRMLTGHAATMNGKGGWAFTAELTANGGVLVVNPPKSADMAKLDGLGFIGFMTMGMHHQEHHWTIVNGGQPHHN
jgi:hypothetical protein